ncbi:MAG: MBOAT family O-acyltransferase [Oscillospiraceae bacterium]
MSFTSAFYLLFLPLVMIIYYTVPKRVQNLVLAAASIAFYWLNLPKGSLLGKNIMPLVLLLCSAAFTYFIVLNMDAKQNKLRKGLVATGIAVLVAVLCVFKYQGLFIPLIFAPNSLVKLAFPLGISYYTFASISYIVDVYRGDIKAEKSFLRLFTYLSFFGTITCGPICRAGKILPQLDNERHFDIKRTTDAMRLALIGFFKLIAVANVIGLSVNMVYANVRDYGGMALTLAAVLYAFELYYEFSGFSDLAVATGAMLGIEVPQNFNTPYFATNFSGFWSRWHISLSTWLQDYIFMPLVWGRWTSHIPVIGKKVSNPPMISSVALVFIISGFWHGNTLPFIIWGAIQAIYRVGEELLHKYYKKPAKKPRLALRIFKTVSVFMLWSISLILFRCGSEKGGVTDAVYYITHLFAEGEIAADIKRAVMGGFYPDASMVPIYLAFVAAVLGIAIFMDWYQCFKLRGKHISKALVNMPIVWRWIVYYALMGIILLGFIMQSGGYGGNVSLAYAGF